MRICVLLQLYENIYAGMWSIWTFWALQVSHPDPWAHIRVPHVQCVRVFKTNYSVHTCTCTGARNTSLVHATNAHTPAQDAYVDGAATPLH